MVAVGERLGVVVFDCVTEDTELPPPPPPPPPPPDGVGVVGVPGTVICPDERAGIINAPPSASMFTDSREIADDPPEIPRIFKVARGTAVIPGFTCRERSTPLILTEPSVFREVLFRAAHVGYVTSEISATDGFENLITRSYPARPDTASSSTRLISAVPPFWTVTDEGLKPILAAPPWKKRSKVQAMKIDAN
jgi:hypothetical protein